MEASLAGEPRPSALTPDPGRPATALLGLRFARSELHMLVRRLARRLGLLRLYDVVPHQWSVPDSRFAVQAIAYAQSLCPDYMIRHCFRSYCFGAVLAARNRLKLDRELFFVAAMLHDLGLSEAHARDAGSFEWVGARLAYDFSLREGRHESVAATIHDAIALHTSVGIAGSRAPELALLHYGTGMDLFGMRVDEIPEPVMQVVLRAYPRSGFKQTFGRCLHHQAAIKPDSHIAAAVGIGITDRIVDTLSSST